MLANEQSSISLNHRLSVTVSIPSSIEVDMNDQTATCSTISGSYRDSFRESRTLQSVSSDALHEIRRNVMGVAQKSIKKMFQGNEFTLNKLNVHELKICGRDGELARIKSRFLEKLERSRRVGEGGALKSCLVSVSGYSGMGKTALVGELGPIVREAGGFYCYGKCNAQRLGEPYAAFSAALESLLDQVMSCDEQLNATIRLKVVEMLGSDWTELSDVVPNLANFLNQHQDTSRTMYSPNVRGPQLCFLLQLFLRAITSSRDIPVAIVLDDLQWVDPMSLQMLEAILTDPLCPPIQLVITYRDHEVEEAHCLAQWLCSVEKQAKVDVDRIELGPLDVAATNSIVSTLLRHDEESTLSLSEVIHRKTGGNAFFVIQFLHALIDDDLLQYNFGTLKWSWVLDEIQILQSTDNVGELMSSKLRKFPEKSQIVLQVASCLGQSFEEFVVSRAIDVLLDEEWLFRPGLGFNSGEVEKILDSFVENHGLMDKHGNAYSFVHDQIQQAAMDLVRDDSRLHLRRHVGECLFLIHSETHVDHYLFVAVDLCNEAICVRDLLEDRHEDLSRHNLAASEKAMRKAAFTAALRYSECGLSYLGPGRWSKHLELTLSLTSVAIEAAYCVGDYRRVETHYHEATVHALSLVSLVRIYSVRILTLGSKQRVGEATFAGLSVLKRLKVLNLSVSPSKSRFIFEILRTKSFIKKHTAASLLSLPKVKDERWAAAFKIADATQSVSYMTNPLVSAILALRMVQWSIEHGLAKASANAFNAYGMVLCGLLGKYKEGLSYGEIALALARASGHKDSVAKTVGSFYAFVYHWTNDTRTAMKPLLQGFEYGMLSGDKEIAIFNIMQRATIAFHSASRKLDLLLQETDGHCQLTGPHEERVMMMYLRNLMQLMENLSVPKGTDPSELCGSCSDENTIMKNARMLGNRGLEARITSYRMYIAYMFGDYTSAAILAKSTRDFGTKVVLGHVTVPWHVFYSGLTATASAIHDKNEPRKNLKIATEALKRLEHWHSCGNVNIAHMILLLRAECAFIYKKYSDASKLYRDALVRASRSGFLNEAGLACERAAALYEVGIPDAFWAAHYYKKAIQYFEDWGAYAKVIQIRRTQSTLLDTFHDSKLRFESSELDFQGFSGELGPS